jgi:hypothetical protein
LEWRARNGDRGSTAAFIRAVCHHLHLTPYVVYYMCPCGETGDGTK